MKTLKILLNALVLVVVVLFAYEFIFNQAVENITVSCEDAYNGTLNEMTVICDVQDPDSLITTDHPLELVLWHNDTSTEIISLQNGSNTFLFDNLDYATTYEIVVSGYTYIDDTYESYAFYTNTFYTITEGYNVPVLLYQEETIGDLEFGFSVTVNDPDELTNAIYYELYDDNQLTDEGSIDSLGAIQQIDGLNELTAYRLLLYVEYIVDIDNHTTTFDMLETFVTLATPEAPIATISNVTNDNAEISFLLDTLDNDATDVFYRVELQDSDHNVLDSVVPDTSTITFDVSLITGDFTINVIASYDYDGATYTDKVLYTYSVYNNEYATFFNIPTLSKIDTSAPLTNYNQYKDYLYTYIDEGVTSFTITCEASLDCTTLVEQDPFSDLPFLISDVVHPYHSLSQIGFSYTDEEIDITTTLSYTQAERDAIDSQVNTILNTIITESMTPEDQIQAVHDYIINNAEYDQTCYENSQTCDNDHSALGILFDGNAVCEGYAHLTDIMLRALRIKSFRISSETHQWNAVYIDDQWLHMDTTWDDPIVEHGPGVLRYDYYLITTIELHVLDTESHTYDTTIINYMN
ncbi:transglutaminase domain-containing protein [Candidatus Xianfuyuplasma coldseepsis]|uniref:Transglutaminase domain-containing protein n=1 Tax=Candidatus Xianfuyuplasma coldseepsis TaxID=2782163 RepID=A0A7L7KQI7_9MOLU|nr:transglutaminase-like domain-containing protein [Xianfuyuplasma coldseepsis]QMS84699.1 transglutaminase domain-containing protein [Xianfuyuplasma coldseepsis]